LIFYHGVRTSSATCGREIVDFWHGLFKYLKRAILGPKWVVELKNLLAQNSVGLKNL